MQRLVQDLSSKFGNLGKNMHCPPSASNSTTLQYIEILAAQLFKIVQNLNVKENEIDAARMKVTLDVEKLIKN